MSEDEVPKRKRAWIGYAFMGVIDIVLSIVIMMNAVNQTGLTRGFSILVATQLTVGLVLIIVGGSLRPFGKVLVYGLAAAIAIVLGLGLLVFAVCSGM